MARAWEATREGAYRGSIELLFSRDEEKAKRDGTLLRKSRATTRRDEQVAVFGVESLLLFPALSVRRDDAGLPRSLSLTVPHSSERTN